MGRQPGFPPNAKLTPEVVQRAVEATKRGLLKRHVAAVCGVAESTFFRWLAEGEAGKGRHTKALYDAVRRAEAELAERLLVQLQNSGMGCPADLVDGRLVITCKIKHQHLEPDWRAIDAFLGRRFPSDYGKQTVEVSGPNGGPVQLEQLGDAVVKSADVCKAAHDLLDAISSAGEGDSGRHRVRPR